MQGDFYESGSCAPKSCAGELDGNRCLLDWKTTSSRYPEEPKELLSLDPQLTCHSWITGISEVAMIVFVRKHLPEIQYLKASISEEQRQEFGRVVETTVEQIESGHFASHSGIHRICGCYCEDCRLGFPEGSESRVMIREQVKCFLLRVPSRLFCLQLLLQFFGDECLIYSSLTQCGFTGKVYGNVFARPICSRLTAS